MYDFMIFKDNQNTKEENDHYNNKIRDFAEIIASGYSKEKKVLLITGSGISDSVPNMTELMNKIIDLIESETKPENRSPVFKEIFDDYCNAKDSEKHQMQSRLLTYVQNAYLGKKNYVQSKDLKPLSNVWERFVEWLLRGDEDWKGIIKAEPSKKHIYIKELYKNMNAISITTNFDNLLQKTFNKGENFYPILDKIEFDNYYLSKEDDESFIEIQSRGDAFWLECTGTRNKICPNRHKQCFVPGEKVEIEDDKIVCNLCKSEAKIYFAFPGTKEKDLEMSIVINGVWKYWANTVSSIIVIGNSMDYDPVLIEFLREIIQKRRIPVMYISRYKVDGDGVGIKSYTEIYKKEATNFLFSEYEDNKNIWAKSKKTEDILKDLIKSFNKQKEKLEIKSYGESEANEVAGYFENKVKMIFDESQDFKTVLGDLKQGKNIPGMLLDIDKVMQMEYFSQLGLKTYWLRGNDSVYMKHNRLKHSVGVMLIASYLYFKVSNKPNKNELCFLQLAALFHDLGHLPFSHLLEEVFDEFGWIPTGEKTSFNHEQHTRQIIQQLVEENSVLQEFMNKIGYSITELQQLINGEYGKGYLDALINSPIDCDKIEYLFSDAIFMNRGTKEDFEIFIKSYVENLSINKNNFLIIEKNSTKSFLNLIRMRGEMYDQVYLRSGLRYLESCCKLIIRTFISYLCTEEDVFISVEDKEKFEDYFNLSDSKIRKIINFVGESLENIPMGEVCEVHLLEQMVNRIKENVVISELMKNTVDDCMQLIKNTHGSDDIKKIEEERILTFEISINNFNKSMLKQLLKNVYLRFPGVILIDFVESKSSFSFGKRENRKRRSDGTRSATENILIKDIRQSKGKVDKEFKCLGDVTEDVNKELHYSNYRYINIYRISDNLFYYMQAEDYIVHELRKEGIIDET